MIEIDEVTKKFPRVYRTVDDINNFLIRIRLNNDSLDVETEEVITFKWQQKRFSPHEREHYKDTTNCLTDLAREYHAAIKKLRGGDNATSIIFSYVENDNYTPDNHQQLFKRRHGDNKFKSDTNEVDNELVRLLKSTTANQTSIDNDDKETIEHTHADKLREYDYFESLKASYDTAIIKDINKFQVMYIMADFGEYYQSTWLQSEQILCTIKYNPVEKIIILTPDFTMFEPYIVNVTTDETKTIRYCIENATLDGVSQKELLREMDILHQVAQSAIEHQKCVKHQVEWTERPQNDNMNVHIFVEILAAWNFDADNIFIRYYIDLNDSWTLTDHAKEGLTGVTMACSRVNQQNGRCHFGFPIDISIRTKYDYHEKIYVHDDPIIYFELISKDTWCRYRCEGLTHLALPIWLPGGRTEVLRCFRLTSSQSGIIGELRRFFIGDCANYNDMKLFGPQKTQCINRLAAQTKSTGCLEVRTSVMHVLPLAESGIRGDGRKTRWNNLRELWLREKLRDPALTKSVLDVVDAFKKARDAMLVARNAAVTIAFAEHGNIYMIEDREAALFGPFRNHIILFNTVCVGFDDR